MEGNKEQKIVNAKIELSVVIEEWSLISEQFLNTIREVVHETNGSTANALSSVTINFEQTVQTAKKNQWLLRERN